MASTIPLLRASILPLPHKSRFERDDKFTCNEVIKRNCIARGYSALVLPVAECGTGHRTERCQPQPHDIPFPCSNRLGFWLAAHSQYLCLSSKPGVASRPVQFEQMRDKAQSGVTYTGTELPRILCRPCREFRLMLACRIPDAMRCMYLCAVYMECPWPGA